MFPLIKFAPRLENYFRNMGRRNSRHVESSTIFFSIAFFHAHLLGQIDSSMVGAAAPILGSIGMIELMKRKTLGELIPLSSIMITTPFILQQFGIYLT